MILRNSRRLICAFGVWAFSATAAWAQVCNAPNDGVTPADAAINACFSNNGSVLLPGGTYLITNTIWAFNSNTAPGSEFASVPGQLATLVAATNMYQTTVHAGNGANQYRVHDLHINGSLDQGRVGGPDCTFFPPQQGYNLSLDGDGWQLYNVESGNSPCANIVAGYNNFDITNVYIWHSGTSHCGPGCGGPVGDGLVILPGTGGEVWNVTIDDATDIGLHIGGGSHHIWDVRVRNINHRGLAGFNTGALNGSGNHSGAIYENIQVQSAYDMLAIGILLGAHPWSVQPGDNVVNAGTVRNNSATGAMINGVVDGIANIQSMTGNTFGAPQGSGLYAAPGCVGYSYTAWHFNNPPAPIQPGWQGLQYDLGIQTGKPCEVQ
jgi:hypothetical protein